MKITQCYIGHPIHLQNNFGSIDLNKTFHLNRKNSPFLQGVQCNFHSPFFCPIVRWPHHPIQKTRPKSSKLAICREGSKIFFIFKLSIRTLIRHKFKKRMEYFNFKSRINSFILILENRKYSRRMLKNTHSHSLT